MAQLFLKNIFRPGGKFTLLQPLCELQHHPHGPLTQERFTGTEDRAHERHRHVNRVPAQPGITDAP